MARKNKGGNTKPKKNRRIESVDRLVELIEKRFEEGVLPTQELRELRRLWKNFDAATAKYIKEGDGGEGNPIFNGMFF